jgi:hypothetical protein
MARIFASGLVTTLALLGLCDRALCAVTTWSFDSVRLQYRIGPFDEPTWVDYTTPLPSVAASPLAEGIRLTGGGPSGMVFTINGSQFNSGLDHGDGGNRLVLTGQATIDEGGWLDPDYFITTQVRAAATLTAGVFHVLTVDANYALFDSGGSFLDSIGSAVEPGVFGPGTSLIESSTLEIFNRDWPEARRIEWTLFFGFNWSGFASDDSLSFTIPNNSIDIVAVVPSPPAALGLATAALCATAAARRRRITQGGMSKPISI